jgi:hypothetical protein
MVLTSRKQGVDAGRRLQQVLGRLRSLSEMRVPLIKKLRALRLFACLLCMECAQLPESCRGARTGECRRGREDEGTHLSHLIGSLPLATVTTCCMYSALQLSSIALELTVLEATNAACQMPRHSHSSQHNQITNQRDEVRLPQSCRFHCQSCHHTGTPTHPHPPCAFLAGQQEYITPAQQVSPAGVHHARQRIARSILTWMLKTGTLAMPSRCC